MTPQEKDFIQAVFDRLAKASGSAKDAEAETFIQEQVRRQPDAAYGLTQAVIVLEAGLNQAQQKISEMQRQLDEARAGSSAGSSGGFLGGASPWGSSSVPRSGPAPQPQPAYAPQPVYAQPQQPWAQAQPSAGPWVQQPSGGSSFLRNAATMAVGVAGGTLIAEGLSSMFGHNGGYGGFGGGYGGGYGGGGFAGGPEIIEERTTVTNNYFDERSSGGGGNDRDTGSQDTSAQDASYDDSGSFDSGGFDDSGSDV